MDDSVFDELMGQTFGDAPADERGSSTATAVMDAESAGWVTEDPVAADPDGEYAAAPGEDPGSLSADEPTEADVLEAQQLLNNLFHSGANPYRQQAEEAQRRIDQSLALMDSFKAQQQRAAMDAALQQRIARLPDLDPQTQAMEVRRLVAEREAMTQVQMRQQVAQREQQAEALAKNQVVAMLADRHGLTQAEVQTMTTLNDPWRMEEFAQMASNTRAQAMGEVEQLRQQLAQYESRQVARQRMASGADRVGSGMATGGAQARSPQPRNFDEFWEQWVGQG
jgi:hypothetical protein